ncbi:MAG: phosphatase PAP2 family protein [Bacteroidales bacterium]|nr:phosphatase PAP2 family protein [Bacteroidales bacterium]
MKEFVENLLPYERNLFFLLNGSDSVFLDSFMRIISTTQTWLPLYLLVLFLVFYKTTSIKQSIFITFFFILMVTLCDQFSSGLIKPIFERLRPGHHPDFKEFVQLVNGRRGGTYSFISGHATNSFGFAVLLSLVFRHRMITIIALIWATFIAYSRVYLGMHFISDIIGGMISGTLISLILYYFVLIPLRKRIFKIQDSEKTQLFSKQHGKMMWIGFAVYFVAVIFYSQIIVFFNS